MAQHVEGYYPRLNAAMLRSGKYVGIVSFVGKVKSQNLGTSQLEFECCDGGVIVMDLSNAEIPDNVDMKESVWEAIGSVDEDKSVTVRIVWCAVYAVAAIVCHSSYILKILTNRLLQLHYTTCSFLSPEN
jgi:hypothetical protein